MCGNTEKESQWGWEEAMATPFTKSEVSEEGKEGWVESVLHCSVWPTEGLTRPLGRPLTLRENRPALAPLPCSHAVQMQTKYFKHSSRPFVPSSSLCWIVRSYSYGHYRHFGKVFSFLLKFIFFSF